MTDQTAIRFGPRESRGWLLGMTSSQLVMVVAAAWALTRVINADSGPTRMGWVGVIAVLLVVAFVPLRGRTTIEYVPVVANFLVQRATGHDIYRGGLFRMADDAAGPEFMLPGDMAHLRLVAFDVDGSGGAQVAVIKDPRLMTYTAVLALEGSAFSLLETSARGSRVEAWGSMLAQLCAENAVLARLQVLERTVPESGDSLDRDWQRRGVHDGSLQAANYEQLLAAVHGSVQMHECFVSVAVDARRAGSEIRQAGGGDRGAAAVLFREIDKVTDGLRAAGVTVEGWCPPRLVGQVIRTAYDPELTPLISRRGGAVSDFRGGHEGLASGVDPRICGPMRAENNWSFYRTDSAVHRCWWVMQWPRRHAQSGFLAPLLLSSQYRRTVSVVLEPITPSRANRRVGVKQSNAVGEGALREKFRRRTTRRQQVEAGDVNRREDELVAGHGMYRMLGFVSVSARDLAELEAASGDIESLGQRSQLELVRLSGEHDQAFGAAALPLARGLR